MLVAAHFTSRVQKCALSWIGNVRDREFDVTISRGICDDMMMPLCEQWYLCPGYRYTNILMSS